MAVIPSFNTHIEYFQLSLLSVIQSLNTSSTSEKEITRFFSKS
jgi:hypothetical protein